MKSEKVVTVCCRKRDPRKYEVPKYAHNGNHLDGDIALHCEQTGQYHMRILRDTRPDPSRLSMEARWVFERCPDFVGTIYPRTDFYLYSGRTQADHCRQQARDTGWVGGSYHTDRREALAHAERVIACYNLESKMACFNPTMPVVEPDQSDEDYWEGVIAEWKAAGVVRIECHSETLQI